MAEVMQDGRFAWILCAASFMVMVIKGGFVYSSGMFYIMFQNGLEAGDGALALITSLNISVHFLVCPVAGMLGERFGERQVAMIGAFLATVGYASSALCTNVYQLYFTFGLTAGIGLGMSFNPSISILSKYFTKHKRTACGMSLCGLGVGSFIIPPVLKALEDEYGWRGAILLMAGISSHALVFCAIYRPVEKKKIESLIAYKTNTGVHMNVSTTGNITSIAKKETEVLNPMVNIHEPHKEDNMLKSALLLFKIVPFFFLSLFSLLIFFPMFIVYTHFGSYALTLGYMKQDVVQLYIAMGVTSTITRALMGFVAQITEANTSALVSGGAMILAVLTAILPLTHRLELLYAYAVAFQVFMAPYNVLCPVIVMDSVPEKKVPSGYGIVCFFDVPGTTLGPPLAALIYARTHVYANSFYLAAGLFLLAGLSMLPAAVSMHKSAKKRQNQNLEPRTNPEGALPTSL